VKPYWEKCKFRALFLRSSFVLWNEHKPLFFESMKETKTEVVIKKRKRNKKRKSKSGR
jgi:hypothetical protein